MKRNRIGMKITVCAFACALLTLTACKSIQTAQQEPGEGGSVLPDAAIGPTGDVRALVTGHDLLL